MYKPLPESLTIKTSKVNGLGLFAKENIAQATNLGMTHIKMGDNIFRTPLGGFINHSTTPNCKTFYEGRLISIITITDIKIGEELTLRYTMYNPSRT